jgi:hypothetical protein
VIREQPETIEMGEEEGFPSSNPPQDVGKSLISEQTIGNTPISEIQNRKSKIVNPLEAILAVVSDLDGLLSPAGLASLLVAAPGEVVPFSDHELCGLFHGSLSLETIETHIQSAIQSKRLALTRQQRLILERSVASP